MERNSQSARLGLAAALFAGLVLTTQVAAQTQTENVVSEVRTQVFFNVSDAVVQSLLPAGFVTNPVAAGAAQGADFTITFIERKFATDPAGAPLGDGTNLMATFTTPARHEASGRNVTLIVGGYVRSGAPGAYGNYGAATATLERTERTADPPNTEMTEAWSFQGQDGGSLHLQLRFTRGVPTPANFDVFTYSAANPEFYRNYKGEQGVVNVRSIPGGIDRVSDFDLDADGGFLASVFDGDEAVVAVNSLVWYRRQTFVP